MNNRSTRLKTVLEAYDPKAGHLVAPLDRLLMRFGLIQWPLAFQSWKVHVGMMSLYWCLTFAPLHSAFMALVFMPVSKFGETFMFMLSMNLSPQFLSFYLGTSLLVGLAFAWTIRRAVKKLNLPSVEQLERELAAAA